MTGRIPACCSTECTRAFEKSRAKPKETWATCAIDWCSNRVRASTALTCNACYTAERKLKAGACQIAKCSRVATRVGHGLCEVHYYRYRRTGKCDLPPRAVVSSTTSGYKLVKNPTHPLAMKNGWASEHRIVAYQKYNGSLEIGCHWCGKHIDWSTGVVDHINNDKVDNRPENLVVTCNTCNRLRGFMLGLVKTILPTRYDEFIDSIQFMRKPTA